MCFVTPWRISHSFEWTPAFMAPWIQISNPIVARVMQFDPALQILLDQMPTLVAYWDCDQRNRYVNRVGQAWFGEAPEALRGRSLPEVLGDGAHEQNRAHIEAVLQGEPQLLECMLSDASGAPRHVEIQYFPDIHAGTDSREVRGFFMLASDQTERKRIESELRASRNQLRDMVAHHEVACEHERKHLAREVHDELGQLLTAMRMDLGMLRPHGEQVPAVARLVGDMDMLLDQMFKVTRQVVTSLRPAALDAGLVAALEWLAQDFSKRFGVQCQVDAGAPDLHLPEALAAMVFRIAQESLTNVARHAQATQVWISLSLGDGRLKLRVQDDGRGFDFQSVRHQPGYGLLSMRERVLSLGGILCIDSAAERGTTIDIDVPANGHGPAI